MHASECERVWTSWGHGGVDHEDALVGGGVDLNLGGDDLFHGVRQVHVDGHDLGVLAD